jgi:predicted Zn-dependent protease with MMP-like domain
MIERMIHVSEEVFERLVEEAVASIPKRFADHLENVSFYVAEEPTREQLGKHAGMHGRVTLLGLYEGIPLPRRSNGYTGVLPDVITVFKRPHEAMASDMEELAENVHQTVWHEVAHYFGLDHGKIHELES